MAKKIEKQNQNTRKKNQLLLKMWKKEEERNGVEIKNKIGKQKSTCVVCDSKKLTFLKPIKPNKKEK